LILLFGIILSPIISGYQINDNSGQIGKDKSDNFEISEKTENTGKIYGYTHCSNGVWTWDPIPNAIVRIGLRITKSYSNGYYEINGLKINRTYRVIANHMFYSRTVEKIKLTSEKPERSLYIDMNSFLDLFFEFIDQILEFFFY